MDIRIIGRLLILLLLENTLAATTNKTRNVDTFMLGGSPVQNVGQFPSFVGVQHTDITRFCGGVILNPNHVLTSGSCVLNENNHLIAAGQLFIRGGDVNLGAAAIIPVLVVYVHPHFNPFNHQNDLAVLRLTFNIDLTVLGLEAATFNQGIVPEITPCRIPGWNVAAGQPQQLLQFLEQPIFEREDCAAVHNRLVDDSMLCAGGVQPGTGVCPSNVGGGLYCNSANHEVSAILSFGTGCGLPNSPGVYTQIRFYQVWIEQQFARNDVPQPGPTPEPGLPGSGTFINVSIVLVFVAMSNVVRNIF